MPPERQPEFVLSVVVNSSMEMVPKNRKVGQNITSVAQPSSAHVFSNMLFGEKWPAAGEIFEILTNISYFSVVL